MITGPGMTSNQTQKAGDQSVNIQGRDIAIGISYSEARQIAQDTFDANFCRLSGVAKDTAQERAELLIDKYLKRLLAENAPALATSTDPDMQYAIFSAQKAYARTGDRDLSDILVDILVRRAAQAERSLLQIVLNESLEVAPKLTKDQFDTLSLIFILKYTKRLNLTGLEDFYVYLANEVGAFCKNLSKDNSQYQHLEYAGCGTVQVTQISIEEILRKNYSGMLSKGLTAEAISLLVGQNTKEFDGLFIPCLHDPLRSQFRALNDEILVDQGKRNGLNDEVIERCMRFRNNYLMKDEEIKDHILKLIPTLSNLFDVWNSSWLKKFNLTSVGIAIAHANIRRRLPDEAYDLSIWIK
jgi:hypothetical protein